MTPPRDYRQALIADQRLLILQHLAGAADQCAPAGALRAPLTAARHQVSHDQLDALLQWLDEAGLIQVLGQAAPVARLTVRGEDVAAGLAAHPGVAAPA
ncbi:MAG: ArsR family transcriptional regulator [Chromatiaceae bacterium]|nr:ArsR family transcriptional regulator [Chromatiaceae bacterium]